MDEFDLYRWIANHDAYRTRDKFLISEERKGDSSSLTSDLVQIIYLLPITDKNLG